MSNTQALGHNLSDFPHRRALKCNSVSYGTQNNCYCKCVYRYHLEDLDVVGRIILKWIFLKRDGAHGLDRSGSG